jgi:hypothetical protein
VEVKMDQILDLYMDELDIKSSCYEFMGQLLDRTHIEQCARKLNTHKVYIYGGGYIGIQLYRVIQNLINVISVVDKSGKLRFDLEDIPVIDLENLKEQYKDELVIVTPIQFYRQIYRDLSEFIPEKNIIFIGKFLGD